MRSDASKSWAALGTPISRINVGRSIPSDHPRLVGECQYPASTAIHDKCINPTKQGFTILSMDYKKEIGRRIKTARNDRGWTLVQLSKETNDVLSDTRISNYETGERMPGPADAVVLAAALKVRAAYLMGVDDVQLQITSQEESLVRNWRTLPENQRMKFYREIEQISMAFRDPVTDSEVEKHLPRRPKAIALRRVKK